MRKVQSWGLLIAGVVTSGVLLAQDNGSMQSDQQHSQAIQSSDRANESTPRNMEVPAGTDVVVRTNDAIDSTVANQAQSYSATVQENVVGSDGQTLIPKGSDARLTVRQTTSGGTTGSPQLVLGLESITIRGRRYEVNTADIQQSNDKGIGKNRRTAEYIGGGAALGTLLGAIAGGGKGAAIGAVAGAAAGGTAQVLTKGKEVKIPSETTLTFRLDQPLTLSSND